MYKQVIIIRKDLEMGKGKIAAQTAHASMGSAMRAGKDAIKSWNAKGAKKIVLKAPGEAELLEFEKFAQREGLPHFLVRDAGKTQIESGTITALGIGPAEEADIDKITGKLQLL